MRRNLKVRRVDELPNDPKKLSLRQVGLKLEQAEIAQESSDYEKLLKERHVLTIAYDDIKQTRGFAKADQDEIYYHWKHHQHQGKDYKPYEKKYWELEEEIARLGKEVEKAAAELKIVADKVAKYDNEAGALGEGQRRLFCPVADYRAALGDD